MEVVSLSVLIALYGKNAHFCMMAIMELPQNQVAYIK